MVKWKGGGGPGTAGPSGDEMGLEGWKTLSTKQQGQLVGAGSREATKELRVTAASNVEAQNRAAAQKLEDQRLIQQANQDRKDLEFQQAQAEADAQREVEEAARAESFEGGLFGEFDPTGMTNVNFENFLKGLGGGKSAEFTANWGMGADARPDWSIMPENMAAARHLEGWLRMHDPHINVDPETGTLKFMNDKLKVGSNIPPALENILGVKFGMDVGDRGANTGKLTAEDIAFIIQEQDKYDMMYEWTSDLVTMGLNNQQDAWESDIKSAADTNQASLKDMFDQNMAFANAQYQSQLAEIQAAETRKAERVRGEENRASLTHEFNLRQTELEDEYNRAKGLAEQDRVTMIERIGKQMDAEKTLIDRQHELDIDLREAELEFQSEQSALDRALEQGQLDEVTRHNQNLEILDAQRNALAKDQLKVEMVSQISNNPAFLFYAKSSGMLDILADALGGSDSANEMYEALVGFVPADMSQQNIQEFNRMSSMEQSLQQFGIAASRGLSKEQQNLELIAQAPRDPRLGAKYVKPEIRPGRGADPSLFDFSTEAELGAMEPMGGTQVRRVGTDTSVMVGRHEDADQVGAVQPTEGVQGEGVVVNGAMVRPTEDTTSDMLSPLIKPSPSPTASSLTWGATTDRTQKSFASPNIMGNAMNDAKATFEAIGFSGKHADQMAGGVASAVNQALQTVPANQRTNLFLQFTQQHLDQIITNQGYQGDTARDKRYREMYNIPKVRMA